MPAEDDEANRETARQIELQRPGWMVVWGVYSRQYVAFPLSAAPPGTIVTARYPPALAPRMAAAERRAQGIPVTAADNTRPRSATRSRIKQRARTGSTR